jgi:hypothetical protein
VAPGLRYPLTQGEKKAVRKLKPDAEGAGKAENEKVLCPPDGWPDDRIKNRITIPETLMDLGSLWSRQQPD